MKTNVGGIDKILRIGAGALLAGLGVAGIGAPWTFIGIVPLATGLLGWCPACSLFGIDTCALRGGTLGRRPRQGVRAADAPPDAPGGRTPAGLRDAYHRGTVRGDHGAQATIGVAGRSRPRFPQPKEPPMLANLLCPPRRTLIAAAASLCLTSTAFAGAHVDSGGKPKAPPTPSAFYEHTGFDGREAQLGAAVVEAIRKAKPENGEGLNFNPAQTEMLGLAVAKAIKTISNDTPYQHEMNDALVKAQLTALQFAKDNNMLPQMVEHDVKTQAPMINRVAKMIQMGGSPELAIIALTERTACFYQLVQNYKRDGMTIRWQTPYANVLASTRKLGQHNLTVEEIHQVYTVPLLSKQAQVMGMEAEISPVGADGWITMTIKQPAKVAAN